MTHVADVVIVDDDIRLARVMAEQLRRLGLTARATQQLADLTAVDSSSVRVIVDLGVLRNSSAENLAIIRSLQPIVMTGSADPLARLEAASYGGTEFIIKPVSPTFIVHLLKGDEA